MPPRINQAARQQIDWNFDPSGLGDLVSSWIPQPVKDVIPSPIKKAARFGFESMLPDPNQLPDPLGPAGTALNVPKRALKNMTESLIDTLPKYFQGSKLSNIAKELLSSTKIAGYLGGEGQVRGPVPGSKLSMPDTKAFASYSPMFNSQKAKNKFAESMSTADPLYAEVFVPAWRKATNPNPQIFRPGIEIREDLPDEQFVDSLVHELTHLGQDIAPQGSTAKDMDLEKLFRSKFGKGLPYPFQLSEITVRGGPRVNKKIEDLMEQAGSARMPSSERLVHGMEALGTFNFLRNTSDEEAEFFQEHILPQLAHYGIFDPNYAAFKKPRP